jgi:hypothetical protein
VRALLAIAIATALPAAARAQSLRLSYEAPRERACPNEEEFVDLVRARLGHAPFDPSADAELRVSIAARERSLSAEVVWLDPRGQTQGHRTMSARNCQALAEAVAVVASIAIESIEEMPREEPPPAPEPRREEPPPPIDRERPPILVHRREPTPPLDLHARLSAAVGIGYAPGPLPYTAFALGGGIRFEQIGAFLSLEYGDTFAYGGVEGGYGLRGRMLRGRAAFCWLPAPIEVCAAGSVGFLEGEASGVSAPRLGQAALGTAGGIVGATFFIDPHLAFEVQGEIAAMINRISFFVGAMPIWTVPPVLLQLSVSFLFEL